MTVNWGRLGRVAYSRSAWVRPVLLGVAVAVLVLPSFARAQMGSPQYSSIVVDAASGNVLSADNPDDLHHPASLAKMMTLYMLFEAVRDHRVSLDQYVPVSYHAASMEPTKLGVPAGGALTAEQAVLGIVTQSANDAASAVGEMLGGDEDRFAEMMTLRAHALGMTHTTFRNASGLPDPDQWTTARDQAILARHLIQDFPEQYRYFSTPSFVFHGRLFMNHDTMVRAYPGADGLKTGWIRTSGHNLATSAVRGDVRLIGIVLGAASNPERDADMTAQLDAGFQSEGVPILVAHREPAPGFMASAHAATMPTDLAPRMAAAHAVRTQRHAAVEVAAAMEATPASPHGRWLRGKPAARPHLAAHHAAPGRPVARLQPARTVVLPPMPRGATVQPIGVILRGAGCPAGTLKTHTGCLPVRHVATAQ